MQAHQIAAQCYTIRDFCKTAEDFAVSMKKVKALGYAGVQISGVGPIPPAEIRRICDGEGLAVCATHEGGGNICDSTQAVIDRLAALGCRYTAYPYPHAPTGTLDEVKALAAKLDAAGAKMRAAGQVLCYHNHDIEFVKVAGKTVLEWLYDLTDPRNLQGEPDTYWVQRGGGDPVAWCRRLNGRLPLLHMKDLGPRRKADGGLDSSQIMEVGNGNLPWNEIAAAAGVAGCRWYIVEQDTCPGDPFDSLRQSREYLREFVETC